MQDTALSPDAWRSDTQALGDIGRKLWLAALAALLVLGALLVSFGLPFSKPEPAGAHPVVNCGRTGRMIWQPATSVNGSYLDRPGQYVPEWTCWDVPHPHRWYDWLNPATYLPIPIPPGMDMLPGPAQPDPVRSDPPPNE